jgi:hypothetical protein
MRKTDPRVKRSTVAARAAPTQQRRRAKKISITVDEAVVQAMEQEAERSGRTLSAEISDALARELRRRSLHELITEYEAEHGPITPRELASIQAEWQG